MIVRQIDQNSRIVRIIFHDQQHRVAPLDSMTVVHNRFQWTLDQPTGVGNAVSTRAAGWTLPPRFVIAAPI